MKKAKSQIRTYTGVYMDPYDMRPEEVRIEDIAHALSLTTRANGHIHHFYSVAQHSVNCALEAENSGLSRRVQLACLLHDASEIYLADIPRPVKYRLTGYAEAEEKVQGTVYEAFGLADLSPEEQKALSDIDDAMLYYEFVALAGIELFDTAPHISMRHNFELRDMTEVEAEFLGIYRKLGESV